MDIVEGTVTVGEMFAIKHEEEEKKEDQEEEEEEEKEEQEEEEQEETFSDGEKVNIFSGKITSIENFRPQGLLDGMPDF